MPIRLELKYEDLLPVIRKVTFASTVPDHETDDIELPITSIELTSKPGEITKVRAEFLLSDMHLLIPVIDLLELTGVDLTLKCWYCGKHMKQENYQLEDNTWAKHYLCDCEVELGMPKSSDTPGESE